MSPGEISSFVVGFGSVLVGLLTVYFNRKGQVEQRRDALAAAELERQERENERLKADNAELRDLRALIEKYAPKGE
ncbi:hypothetical protein [Kineococcus sp. NPDC059986]|uniref:hypothetical protein n=1 Tax=Actinomycetes TaxID=1760 RepID=UPI00344F7DF6